MCSEEHQQARDAFLLWCSNAKPRSGPIFQLMRISRARFKSVVRQCKAKSNNKESDLLAQKLLKCNGKDFWKEIKKINSKHLHTPLAETVNGQTGADNICEMWRQQFSNLLNSATCKAEASIDSDPENMCFERFTHEEVSQAIKVLKSGKSHGKDKLCGEHYIHADNKINVLLSMFFNAVICHGYIPIGLMETIIVPIVKDKKGDIGSKDNYRPIALTSILSKIFEILILTRYQSMLTTTDNQFGFKQKHSTELCAYTLKQVIEYYKTNSSPIYLCFLDASKAFDRVNHEILFEKLRKRKIPHMIVRILQIWYSSQTFSVQWGHVSSIAFKVSNGVRQGGILSPVLFNVYVDCLSVKLASVSTGCYVNDVCYNHLIYADDTVLLAPSPKALQILIDICAAYAKDNDLIFNAKKTKTMCIKPKLLKCLYVPKFYLDETVICSVDHETYLGFIVNKEFTDNDHMSKEMRNIYARGNMLIRNFKHCTNDVKIKLYRTFCSSIYCCPLWYNFKESSFRKIHVATNKVFKSLMQMPRDYSASHLFVSTGVDNFSVLRRKLVYSLKTRVLNSLNLLVINISASTSFMHRYWKTVLY